MCNSSPARGGETLSIQLAELQLQQACSEEQPSQHARSEEQPSTMPPQRGVRDRGRDRRIGREQVRGEGRGRSGMGGHGSGCNEGNVWKFVDGVMGENVAGIGVVGSVSGGDVSAKGVGGGESGGGSSSTITHEKQKLISKVQVVGARRV